METDGSSADKPRSEDTGGKLGYKLLATAGAAVATAVARKVLDSGWKRATGKEPPADPTHPDVRWHEAVGWAAASAAGLAAAKLFAQRRVAATWRRASGVLPPGMEPEHPEPTKPGT
jgi:Protein of unknown function (DUF4235)